MKIIVTGGAGFLGSNLVEELVRLGDDVVIIDNFSTGSKKNLTSVRKKIKIIRAPVHRALGTKGLKSKQIFHLGIPSSSPMYRDNPFLIAEALNDFVSVFEWAKRNHSKVVYASTSSLYRGCKTPHRENLVSEPFDYYTEVRITMERLARVYYDLHKVSSVGMRFFSIYGPREHAKGKYANNISQFLWGMRLDEPPEIYGDGKQTRDFVHVSDVVNACIMASKKKIDCEAINVGTGKGTSFNHVIKLLNKLLEKSIEPIYCPNPIKNYVYHTLADLTKARKLLGYQPSVDLDEGVRQLVTMGG